MPALPGSRLHRRPVRFRRGIPGGFRGGEMISIRTKRNCSSWALGAGAQDRGECSFGRTAGPRDQPSRARPDLFGVDDSTAPRTGRSPVQGKTSRQITASEVTMGKRHGKRGSCQKERGAGFGRAAHRRNRRWGRFTLADDPDAAGSVRLGGGAGSSLRLRLQSQTPLGLAPVLPLQNGTSASNGPAALKWIAPSQAAATSRGFTSRAMRAPSSRWALRRSQSSWSRTHQPSESPK